MGRGIEFDYDKAIHKATLAFWRSGYSNTSLRDLLKAMRIGEGSFYNSVKSKKHLYLECQKHYRESVGRKRVAALLSQPTIKLGVRAFFKTVLDDLDNPATPRLCLMASSISSDVLNDRELRKFVESGMSAFNDLLTERLEAAKAAGEFPSEFEPEVVAGIIGTYMQGLLRVVLVSYDRKQVERELEVFLTGLGF
jgi:TetR/AcrR family transcriptional regulator, transcriptional repressor for nem operon